MKIYYIAFYLLILCSTSLYAVDCTQHTNFVSNVYNEITEKHQDITEIEKIIAKNLDIQFISRQVLGSYWKTSSLQQKEGFQIAYKKYLAKNFSKIIYKYFGKMTIQNSTPIKRIDGCITNVQFIYNNEPFDVSYLTLKKNNNIYIFDMVFEGINTIRADREQFQSSIPRLGLDGIIKKLGE